jgi:hypothetical protein
MRSVQLVRWSGAAAMLGGSMWAFGAVARSLRPRGCVADECLTRPMRETAVAEGVVLLGAVLLFLAGLAGLVILSRHTGRFGRAGRTGVVLGVAGLVVLLLASLVQALLFAGDFVLMPYFVIPALTAVVLGFVLVGVTVLRAGVLPRWSGVLLIVGALAMLIANEQTTLVLLLVPFGLAWIAVGYLLWSRGAGILEPTTPPDEPPPGV